MTCLAAADIRQLCLAKELLFRIAAGARCALQEHACSALYAHQCQAVHDAAVEQSTLLLVLVSLGGVTM